MIEQSKMNALGAVLGLQRAVDRAERESSCTSPLPLLGTEHFDCEITGNRKRQMVIQDNLTHVFIPLTPAEIEAAESECIINPAWHIVVPNRSASRAAGQHGGR